MPKWLIVGEDLVSEEHIECIDFSDVEKLWLVVHYTKLGTPTSTITEGIQTIDILMALKPSVFESRRLRWAKHAWTVHNLIGHPLMQALAYLRKYDWAMKIHDWTVPRPKGTKS